MAVEAVVSFVINRLGDLLLKEAKFLYGVKDEVEEARRELERINCFLEDADARVRQGNKTIRHHVVEIKEAAYDLEDVIVTFALKAASRSDKGRMYKLQRFPFILTDLHKVGSAVEKITARISKSRSSFEASSILHKKEANSSNDGQRLDQRRVFAHYIDSDFVGFDEDVKELASHLTREGSRHKVVSICGMGGLGKTTLARKIYDHSDIKHHFDCVAWESVSQNCHWRGIWQGLLIQLIYPTVEKRREIKEMGDDEISKQLYEVLKEKKCLVVLDDIWTSATWDCLKSAFPNARSKSKVLFTTRDRDLASYADRDSILHEPKCLNRNESWELLEKKTCFGRNVTDSEDDKRKQKLAQEMLDHCGGLPLAITVLGGLLSNKQAVDEWETLHKNIKTLLRKGKITEQEDSNLGVSWVLGLSYDELPYHLKPCFLYLTSFPEDVKIRAKELCRLWMAEGFASNEVVAYGCLSELVERCLVQVAEWGSTGRIKTCRLHDLMRDLCLSKSQEENFLQAVDLRNQQEANNSSSVSITTNLLLTNKVRRLAVYLKNDNDDELTSLIKTKDACLRSFSCIIPESDDFTYHTQAMKPLLRRFHLLRVLRCEDLIIEKLPKEIGELIHLRLFSLRGSYAVELPSAIGNLICLQTLDLRVRGSYYVLKQLFQIRKLEQMRHLYLPADCKTILLFDNLTNLHTLVNAFANYHCLDGWEKLASLTKLKLILARDFSGTSIIFYNLRSLVIVDPNVISTDAVTAFTEYVISVIVSCPQIYKLQLKVRLVKLPEDKEFSPNLTKLTLAHTDLRYDQMETLEKLPNLRILLLCEDSFKGVLVCRRKGFPKLESLYFSCLHSLCEWRVEEGALPSLRRFVIRRCSSLRRISEGLRYIITLKEIVIQHMSREFKAKLERGGEDFYKVEHVPSLVFNHCNT